MEFQGTVLVCPAGKPGASALRIEMGPTLRAEARQQEIATVTPLKAPELMAEFNRSWRDLHEQKVKVSSELVEAKNALERCRSRLLLEVVPGKLNGLQLSSTKAHCDAVITLDPDFQATQDSADQLRAVEEYLTGKLKSFENAFNAARKIMGEDPYKMQMRHNSNLTVSAQRCDTSEVSPRTPSPLPIAEPPAPTPAPIKRGWVKPRYDD